MYVSRNDPDYHDFRETAPLLIHLMRTHFPPLNSEDKQINTTDIKTPIGQE
jgi:hypothetical protein